MAAVPGDGKTIADAMATSALRAGGTSVSGVNPAVSLADLTSGITVGPAVQTEQNERKLPSETDAVEAAFAEAQEPTQIVLGLMMVPGSLPAIADTAQPLWLSALMAVAGVGIVVAVVSQGLTWHEMDKADRAIAAARSPLERSAAYCEAGQVYARHGYRELARKRFESALSEALKTGIGQRSEALKKVADSITIAVKADARDILHRFPLIRPTGGLPKKSWFRKDAEALFEKLVAQMNNPANGLKDDLDLWFELAVDMSEAGFDVEGRKDLHKGLHLDGGTE
jgi:hypothetical protein